MLISTEGSKSPGNSPAPPGGEVAGAREAPLQGKGIAGLRGSGAGGPHREPRPGGPADVGTPGAARPEPGAEGRGTARTYLSGASGPGCRGQHHPRRRPGGGAAVAAPPSFSFLLFLLPQRRSRESSAGAGKCSRWALARVWRGRRGGRLPPGGRRHVGAAPEGPPQAPPPYWGAPSAPAGFRSA